jgi:hypothetical protein
VFSASSETRDRNAPTNANQIRLQTSRIRQEHRPIRWQLPARLSFRQGQAMLAASPEIVLEYKRRYQSVPSIIASSMAGRAIVRPANLAFIGTTSLYGERPNQYDRTSYRCELVGGPKGETVRYRYLTSLKRSRTSGVGTFQFGRDTKIAIENYMSSTTNGRRVNNVFGDGMLDRSAIFLYSPARACSTSAMASFLAWTRSGLSRSMLFIEAS